MLAVATAAAMESTRSAWAGGFRPDPRLTVAEWAEEKRFLPQSASAEPGRWRNDRTPYLVEIMECLSPGHPAEVIVFRAGAQVGKTETGNNWIGYVVDHAPGPMMMVNPTLDMAKRSSKQRIAPMIDACPTLAEKIRDKRSRDSGNTLLAKEFPGGILIVTGSNSAVGLRSMPARYLFLDEVSAFMMDVDGEGDPVELAIRRTATFGRHRKIFQASTPTILGLCKISDAYERSDKRLYYVPCPHCGDMEPITWGRVQWQKDDDGNHLPETAAIVCEACGSLIQEHHKGSMLAEGEWRATAEGDPGVVGFHLPALYSPLGWYSWEHAVRDFLKAKRRGREALKTWTNTVLGEPFEEMGDGVDHGPLFARREDYGAEVPAPALLLTAGVDVQADRLEIQVDAWGPGEERWPVDYRIIYGDPERPELWQQLDELLFGTKWHRADGLPFTIASTCVDSGFATTSVYDYVKKRQGRGVYAVKGDDGEGRPVVAAPSKKRTGKQRRPVKLFIVGTHDAKRILYGRLGMTEPGPGYVHFPTTPAFDPEYFEQLCAEKLQTRYVRGFSKREWVKLRPRNEALDCSVYSYCALCIRNPNWSALAERIAPMVEDKTDAGAPSAEPDSPSKPRPRRAPARRRRGSWI